MNINDIDKIKGFMPKHEGNALFNWAINFSNIGPILEIGTYCGKSALYLSKGASVNGQLVFTIDHHYGSEEHQLNEEYYDKEIYDHSKEQVNTLPLFIKNVNEYIIVVVMMFMNKTNK